MKPNLFLYLLTQSIFKSLEGAFLGTAFFSVFALGAFLLVQQFPPFSLTELTTQMVLFGICAVALFICFTIAGGIALAVWLFWQIGRGNFSSKDIIPTCTLIGFIVWLAFFALVVAPVTWSIWEDFFTRQDMLAVFFDVLSISISIGSGLWAGWRLSREIEKRKAEIPNLLLYEWNIKGWRTHARLLWQGGGLGVLCAILANFVFVLVFEMGLSLVSDFDFEFPDVFFLAGLGSMFSLIPAFLGGYLIACLLYLEKINGVLTKISAIWQSVTLASFAGFGVCVVIGGLYFTNPHTVSVLFFAPEIFGATITAGILGGATGLVLYQHV